LFLQFLLFANAGFLQQIRFQLTNNFLTYAFLFGRHADLDLTICKKPLYLDIQRTKGEKMAKTTKCGWCGAEWSFDETLDICLICNQMDYLTNTK
jgi:hypothetical protein